MIPAALRLLACILACACAWRCACLMTTRLAFAAPRHGQLDVEDILREEGQGTTEYAILVGVLAVIAMIAIAAFRGKISELWEAISSGVNGL